MHNKSESTITIGPYGFLLILFAILNWTEIISISWFMVFVWPIIIIVGVQLAAVLIGAVLTLLGFTVALGALSIFSLSLKKRLKKMYQADEPVKTMNKENVVEADYRIHDDDEEDIEVEKPIEIPINRQRQKVFVRNDRRY